MKTLGLPEWTLSYFETSERRLITWRQYGWLGDGRVGRGRHFEWDDPEVQRQVFWLKRLYDSGRHLDNEDAIGGYRLRALGAEWGIRVLGGKWESTDLSSLPSVPYTLARVG